MTNINTLHYKKLKDMDSKLVKRIIDRNRKTSFLGATISGERGSGKSMYAYKVMALIYYRLNGFDKTDDEEEAYDIALDHMIFEMDDLISLIQCNIEKDYITPVLTLDDATVHFCSYKYYTNLKEVIYLHGLFDTIRTAVSSVLMTTPNTKLLLSFLRQYDDYKIKIIHRDDKWSRFARCYRWNYLPDEKKYHIYIPFQDNFSCYVRDDYYQKYMVKRKQALKNMSDKMAEMLNIANKMRTTNKLNEI